MRIFQNEGDSIEALDAKILSRDIILLTIIQKENCPFPLKKFKCKMKSSVEILKEIENKKNGGQVNNNANLNIGDTIKGKCLELYVKKGIKIKVISKDSSKHRIQCVDSTKCFTFAEIEIPFQSVLDRKLEIKKIN